ncbi:Mce family protein [Mycobacteroides abscessus subsp. bolletii]|uniref:MlaD family protein n=1 Tax=Mycobacteroides abscessus TaxID=36809 RepID=UPI00092C358A|nr:MlaD family protein [Mycobacteroides abscessus]SHX52989.1 Mce family protein [Mycobacteroides abscessus subsp. bolletii]SKP62135.1 Mce family protein [Mycobacteroides abscessus subsp. bolletii]SKP73735.1 Mce family protein [Mycobacteroides abscessus subsp. bolletii]SKQ21127.1 Mce family protein [Mycobacteroides abscessus subsp. bolletii]
MKPTAASWRLLLSATIAVVLLVSVANAITKPLNADTRGYRAEFTDVAGLHTGADVRIRGVRVGKVTSISVEHTEGRTVAVVDLTLQKRYAVVGHTKLAVKYQALTGLRYLDVVGASEGDDSGVVTRIPTTMTQPSFDITTLFNGLQPVLATLSPEDVNTFTDNAANYLAGNGDGLAPMLDSIRKLTAFVSDRQHVVATLMKNLSDIANVMGGNAPKFVNMLDMLNRPLDNAIKVLDEFRKSQLYGPDFTRAVVKLLDNLGIKPGINIDDAMDRAFTNLNNAIEAFKRIPVIWQNIEPPTETGATPRSCTKGPAELPQSLDVLLNGQRVVICKK